MPPCLHLVFKLLVDSAIHVPYSSQCLMKGGDESSESPQQEVHREEENRGESEGRGNEERIGEEEEREEGREMEEDKGRETAEEHHMFMKIPTVQPVPDLAHGMGAWYYMSEMQEETLFPGLLAQCTPIHSYGPNSVKLVVKHIGESEALELLFPP